LYSSNFDGRCRIQGLPCGRFQPTAPLARIDSYRRPPLKVWAFRTKVLFLRCTAEKSSYLPRPVSDHSLRVSALAPSYVFVRSDASATFQLHELQGGTTSFGDSGLRSPLDCSRFEAFPAVYRAPRLFWHRPGYVFPGVHGSAFLLAEIDGFAIPLRVSRTPGLSSRLLCGGRLPFQASRRLTGSAWGSRDFSVYRGLSAGPRVFLPFRCYHRVAFSLLLGFA